MILTIVTPLLGGKKAMFPVSRSSRETMEHIKGVIQSGAFKPVVDGRCSLDQIVEAYRYVDTGRKIGVVVISVDPAD